MEMRTLAPGSPDLPRAARRWCVCGVPWLGSAPSPCFQGSIMLSHEQLILVLSNVCCNFVGPLTSRGIFGLFRVGCEEQGCCEYSRPHLWVDMCSGVNLHYRSHTQVSDNFLRNCQPAPWSWPPLSSSCPVGSFFLLSFLPIPPSPQSCPFLPERPLSAFCAHGQSLDTPWLPFGWQIDPGQASLHPISQTSLSNM